MNNYFAREDQKRAQYLGEQARPVLDDTLERDRSHLHSYHVSIWIPMTQSLVTAVIFSLDVFVPYMVIRKGFGIEPWAIAIYVFFFVLTIAWVFFLWRWLDLTVPLERFLKQDINHDGIVGAPIQETIKLNIIKDNGRHQEFIEFPCSKGKLLELAEGILNGEAFTYANWAGAGKLFSRGEFEHIRDIFMHQGYLRWVDAWNHDQGVEWTEDGMLILMAFTGTTPPPPA